jgi:hypothetical protein
LSSDFFFIYLFFGFFKHLSMILSTVFLFLACVMFNGFIHFAVLEIKYIYTTVGVQLSSHNSPV